MPSSPRLLFSHLGAIDRSGYRSLSLQVTQDFQTGFYTSVEGTLRANYCRKPGFKRPRSWPAAPPEADPSIARKTRSHLVASTRTRVKAALHRVGSELKFLNNNGPHRRLRRSSRTHGTKDGTACSRRFRDRRTYVCTPMIASIAINVQQGPRTM